MQLHFLRLAFKLLNLVSPRLAARLAVSIFYTPRRYPASNWEQAALSAGRDDQLLFDGEPLAATIWGDNGPTVLLVHGWQGRRGQLGKIALALMAEGFRIVTVDGPAHGSSTKRRTTLVEFAQAVEIAADRYGPLHAIVGHSFGAAASAIALRKGVDARCAVLISCPYSLRHVVRGFARIVGLPNRSHEQMYPIMQRLHRCPESDLSFDTIGPELQLPCLSIHDAADKYIPVSDGEKVSRSIAQAKWIRTQDLGHMRILQAEAVVQQVTDFVVQARDKPSFSVLTAQPTT
jgi:pimeloyl-ACP methyl ester carboxylesterase